MTLAEMKADLLKMELDRRMYLSPDSTIERYLLENLPNFNVRDYVLRDLLSEDTIDLFLSNASLYLTAELLGGKITQIRGGVKIDLTEQVSSYKEIVEAWQSIGWVKIINDENEVRVIRI